MEFRFTNSMNGWINGTFRPYYTTYDYVQQQGSSSSNNSNRTTMTYNNTALHQEKNANKEDDEEDEQGDDEIQTTTTSTTTNPVCPHPELKLLPENVYKPPSIASLLKLDTSSSTTSTSNSTTRIPNIIHMTYKTRCMTEAYIRNIEAWRTEFPNHTIYVHDDDDVDDLFSYFTTTTETSTSTTNLTTLQMIHHHSQTQQQQVFSKIIQYCIPNGAAKADVWRYLVLYVYGGIYTDIDNVPSAQLQPAFDMLRNNSNRNHHQLQRYYHNNKEENTTNEHTNHILLDGLVTTTIPATQLQNQPTAPVLEGSFLAMSKNHPLMYVALEEALLNGLLHVKHLNNLRTNKVTGPGAVLRAFTKLTTTTTTDDGGGRKQQQQQRSTTPLRLYTLVNNNNTNTNDDDEYYSYHRRSRHRTITVLSTEHFPTISKEDKFYLYNLTNVSYWKESRTTRKKGGKRRQRQQQGRSSAASASCQEIVSRHFPGIAL